MKLLLAMLVAIAFGGSAAAFHPAPDHYEVGKVQPFVGLVCKTQAPAAHIFATWQAAGADEARRVYQVYQTADECRFFKRYEAYFVEKIDSMEAKNFKGKLQTVLLFSISPAAGSEIVDFLVTWVELPPGV